MYKRETWQVNGERHSELLKIAESQRGPADEDVFAFVWVSIWSRLVSKCKQRTNLVGRVGMWARSFDRWHDRGCRRRRIA